jgi:nucleoside-diphosphate kinase
LKPDGYKRQLLMELLLRIKIRKLRVVDIRTVELSASAVNFLYGQHRRRKSYMPMKKWLMSGPCVAIHVIGRNAVSQVREMMGTGRWPYPKRTFRGAYATTQWRNVMHASDSAERAEEELSFFF